MKKRVLIAVLLSLLATFVLMLTSCKTNVDGSAGLEYELSEDGGFYTVVGLGECADSELVIPSEYKGLEVGAIGDQAFAVCEGITSVVIPGSVKTVGMQAFARSVNIKSVTFSDGVEDIAKGAFSGCSGLTDIIIPDSVKSIGEGTFNGCSGLTSITLPFVGSGIERPTNYDDSEFRQTLFGYIFGVEYYEGSAKTEQFSSAPSSGTVFYLPFGLETVTVTGGSIYGLAFDGCNNLKKIAVGDGVKRIGNYAFSECKSLAELDLPYLNETAESSISRPICFLFNWGYYNNSYIVNSSLDDGKNFYVPNSLVSVTVRGGWIGNIAFEGMKTLESVTFGDGVRSLGKNVFKGCNALEQVVFTKKGWMLKADDGMTDIDLSDSAINVEKLKGEYADLELVRKLPR